jgi:hypothetical protein
MARIVPAAPTLTQQARSLLGGVRGGAALFGKINSQMERPLVSPGAFGQVLGGLDVGLGTLGLLDTIDNPNLTDAQKAFRAGRNLLQGVQGVGSLTNTFSVPYADFISTGLSIGDIASNPHLDDSTKAYESLHQAGRAVANFYLPVAGGILADGVKALRDHIFGLGPGDYLKIRKREAGALPANLQGMAGLLNIAPTQADLDDMLTAWGTQGRAFHGALDNGHVLLRGTHLDLGPQEAAINDLYQSRQALFAAAAAGDPAAQQQVAQDAARFGEVKGAANLLANQNIDPNLSVPKYTMASSFSGRPQQVEDSLLGVLQGWIDAANSTLRQGGELHPDTLPLIAQWADAANTLGLDLDAAAERKARLDEENRLMQASMSSIGGGE